MSAVSRHNRDTTVQARGHGSGTIDVMTTTRSLLLGVFLLTAACSAPTTSTDGPFKVLFLGDSIAAGEALPLAAAFKASGAAFQSIASDGGGNVVGPFSDKNWKKLPAQITSAKPTVVVYQLTTYDWGSRQEQQAAYGKLLTTVTRAGAKLVFVTAPPIRPDDFYQPHMADLTRAPDAARAVAADSSDQAVVLDASAIWGSTYRQVRDGRADRSTDGVHTCPQGAARFTHWLMTKLARSFPGFTPATPTSWANTGWAADARFPGC